MDTEAYRPILHSLLPFIPQPTNTTCWTISTAIVTRSTVPAVIAKTPADLIVADGGLRNFSDTNVQVTGSARFARTHGMTVVTAHIIDASVLAITAFEPHRSLHLRLAPL